MNITTPYRWGYLLYITREEIIHPIQKDGFIISLFKKCFDDYLNKAKDKLDKEKVVPINIFIGKDNDTLIITGPNTGGKTVSLKTVEPKISGIFFSIMHQTPLKIDSLSLQHKNRNCQHFQQNIIRIY